jgi:Trk-type K+ transport system membrane component
MIKRLQCSDQARLRKMGKPFVALVALLTLVGCGSGTGGGITTTTEQMPTTTTITSAPGG